ncbi:GH23056 [Drosophila grimshawi]|uniref:GH23056 n=1 Tax=Drosophila grimshawi TaxID=7222 RepID=B4JWJ8_DROGR|nr:GH23056 [Drosophila grimshawi]
MNEKQHRMAQLNNNNNNQMDQLRDESDCCSICLMPKTNEVFIRCKHTFCFNCMDAYCSNVHINRRCPLCRTCFFYFERKNGVPLIVIPDEESEGSSSEDDDDDEDDDVDW